MFTVWNPRSALPREGINYIHWRVGKDVCRMILQYLSDMDMVPALWLHHHTWTTYGRVYCDCIEICTNGEYLLHCVKNDYVAEIKRFYGKTRTHINPHYWVEIDELAMSPAMLEWRKSIDIGISNT